MGWFEVATAAQIKRQVRQALAEQNRVREDAVVEVLSAQQRLEAARESVATAESELKDSVGDALGVMSWDELKQLSGRSDLPRPGRRRKTSDGPSTGGGSSSDGGTVA